MKGNRKNSKELKIGEIFKFNMYCPAGFLVLKVQYFEEEIPWCLVIEDFYEEEAKDEYDEEDRYKIGDIFPYSYTYVDVSE